MSTKMKTIRRRIIPGIIFLSALLMSCKFAIIDDIVTAQKSGTLKVTVSMEGTSMKSAERTVVPSITLNAARYEIVCTNSGGTVIASTTLSSLADYTFTNIVPGAITVSIKAYNASSMLIASGSAAVTVSESAPAAANVELKLAKTAGVTSGSIALQIQWPAASATAISWYLDGSDPADLQLAPVISDAGGGMSKATLSAANLTSVVHTVRIYFMNASINQRTGTQLELVNVYDNMTSDSWVNADGTLSDKKVYTTSEAMSMAQSQGTDATVRILAGDTLQTISLTSGTTSITLPNVITTDSITVIPSTGVTGQSLAYSLNEVPYTPIASDSPVILSPPSGGIFSTLDLRVTAPDTGTSTVYSLRIRSPVHVTNQADLITALGTLDNNIVLDNSISLTGTWIPIGSSTTPFTGTFDGNGKTISGLTIDDQLGTYPQAGMFANVGSSATIKNLHLTGVNVFGNATGQMGGLAGVNGGTIFRCSSSGNVTESNQISTGGLIGQNYGTGTVSECWSNATVTGIYYAGGLVGANDGLIINSYARGVVSAVWGGGLAGSNNPGGIIRNSYAAGSVISNGTETNPSFGFLQGLIGNSGGTITNSYFDLSKIATTYKAGAIITSGYFGTAESNKAALNTAVQSAGWDFSSVWIIDPGKNGGYPILRAMLVPDDIILPMGSMDAATLQSNFSKLDGNYIMNGDITITSGSWTPVGTVSAPFTGTFDGGGKTISNIIISSGNGDAGFFGNTNTATISNVRLTNISINCTGGTSGNDGVGGIVGDNLNGTITRCSVSGTIYGSGWRVGGIVGCNRGVGTVSECYSTATVTTTALIAGGLVGMNNGTIMNCYTRGNVSASSETGGLVGQILPGTQPSRIVNCYSASTVNINNTSHLGGLIGQFLGTCTAGFYDSEVSNCSDSGKGLKKTTAEMKNQAMYAGWDIDSNTTTGTSIWVITPNKNAGYPYLRAVPVPDDIIILTSITTAELMTKLNDNLDGNIILSGSGPLVLTDPWSPVGSALAPFTGTFDGGGNTIKITSYSDPAVPGGGNGLFGINKGIIENLKVSATITTTQATNDGILVGINKGYIYRCSTTGILSTNGDDASSGGLVGYNMGTIKECYSNAEVINSGINGHIGGIAGTDVSGSTIQDSYSRCTFSSTPGTTTTCSGLVYPTLIFNTNYINSYSASVLDATIGDTRYGVSYNAGSITHCYYDSTNASSVDPGVGTGISTTDMTNAAIYSTTYPGWDFTNVWAIDPGTNGGYPHLIHTP